MNNKKIREQSATHLRKYSENLWRCFGSDLRNILMIDSMDSKKLFPLLDDLIEEYISDLPIGNIRVDECFFTVDVMQSGSLIMRRIQIVIDKHIMEIYIVSNELQYITFSQASSVYIPKVSRTQGVLAREYLEFEESIRQNELRPLEIFTTEALKAVIKTARDDKEEFLVFVDGSFASGHLNPSNEKDSNYFAFFFIKKFKIKLELLLKFMTHIQSNYSIELKNTLNGRKLNYEYEDKNGVLVIKELII